MGGEGPSEGPVLVKGSKENCSDLSRPSTGGDYGVAVQNMIEMSDRSEFSWVQC